MDRGKELNKKLGMTDAIRASVPYAVDKAGDFSKESVREKDYPRDAEEKMSLDDIEKNTSLGAIRVNDVIARQVLLGKLPGGLSNYPELGHNMEQDSARGIISLPSEDMAEKLGKKFNRIQDALNSGKNKPEILAFGKDRTKMTDKNNKKPVDPDKINPILPESITSSMILADNSPVDRRINIGLGSVPKNREMGVLLQDEATKGEKIKISNKAIGMERPHLPTGTGEVGALVAECAEDKFPISISKRKPVSVIAPERKSSNVKGIPLKEAKKQYTAITNPGEGSVFDKLERGKPKVEQADAMGKICKASYANLMKDMESADGVSDKLPAKENKIIFADKK